MAEARGSNAQRNKPRRYAFVFVCQHGAMEAKALLLAASLKRFLRCKYELVAAIPDPFDQTERPSAESLRLLDTMDVRCVGITNPLGGDYAFGNKLACLQIATDADKLVFVDSDVVCMREFNDEPRFQIPFNAKPADHMTYATDEDVWRQVYDTAGVPYPSMRLPATVSNEFAPPYFNAGWLAIDRGSELSVAWVECCRRIETNETLATRNSPPPHRTYWLDQVGLGVAVAKLNLEFDCLDERYNYPANLKPLDETQLPYFCHYHFPEVVEQEPALRRLIDSLTSEYAGLRAHLASFPDWNSVLARKPTMTNTKLGVSSVGRLLRRRVRTSQRKPADLLITGIPRSGTSYLCNLLHRYSNCVVINEPLELLDILAREATPWSVARLYRRLRADIRGGRPVENKLSQGQVTTDTSAHGEVSMYTPRVDGDDFVLGTKNTVAYLTRLEGVRRVMPHVRIIACVRDPADTIASWKNSFPHLCDVDISGLPVGNEREPWLTGVQRDDLLRIINAGDLAQRRALRWRYLAERILEHRDHVTIVHYDAIVTDPHTVVMAILDGMPKGKLRVPLASSAVRSASHTLDAADRQAIRAICFQSATDLGFLAPTATL
jgi:hypothetical protein